MVPKDHTGPDQSGLDTWLTGVVAICAATLLFSGVLLTGIGAAAHATDPSGAPPSAVETDRRPSPSSEPAADASTESTRAATPPDADDPTTSRGRRPSTARTEPGSRTWRDPDPPGSSEARGPDPGSSPQYALPITVPTGPDDANLDAAAAQDDVGSLDHSSRQTLGEQLFVGGLVGLLFSIGGLVTIAVRRRAW